MRKEKLLVADDDFELLQTLTTYLEKQGFPVLVATNGVEALAEFKNNEIEVLVTDIRMPEMDGITLLRHVRQSLKQTRVILMTGFSEILETKSAFELGADEFLSKPFRMKDLMDAISQCLIKRNESKSRPSLDNNFFGINIEEFVNGSQFDSPVYIRLSELKYCKLGNVGEDISRSRVVQYKTKGVEKLYLLKSDYEKFLNKTKKQVHDMVENKAAPVNHQKIEMISQANSTIMRDIFSRKIDRESFEESKEILTTTMNVVGELEDVLKIIQNLANISDEMYAHSVGVSMFALMLSKKLEWISDKNKSLISMGALFHDIGKKNLPKDLMKKKLIELTYEEKKLLEDHPKYGAEILQEIPKIPPEVVTIALQHHETCNGTGYPNKLYATNIHPMAKVISVANEYMNCLAVEQDSTQEQRVFNALKKLVAFKGKGLEKDFLNKFIGLFGFDSNQMGELYSEQDSIIGY